MLRVGSKSLHRSGNLNYTALKASIRSVSGESAEKAEGKGGGSARKGGGGFFKAVALIGTAGVAGGLALAHYDPDIRRAVEATVPQSKTVFDTLLGPINRLKQPEMGKFPPKPVFYPSKETSNEDKLTSVADLTPQPSAIPVTPKEFKKVEELTAIDVRSDKAIAVLADGKKAPGHDIDIAFEGQIVSGIEQANKCAIAAKDAKLRTIRAQQAHSRVLKEAVDSGVEQKDGNEHWAKVRTAKDEVQKCAKQDAVDEGVARGAIDHLKRIIATGKANGVKSPTMLNAQETASKLLARLDELNMMIEKEKAQTSIFTNYKDLVEKGRQQWAEELKSVFPNIDARAKEGSLSKDELDAFIVHANLRVDQLKRQLAELQIQEEQRIANAIEEQRKLDESLAQATLDIELRRIRDDKDLDLESKVNEERKLWELELEARLTRAKLAHAEHLEQVIKTQKQLHDIENAQLVQEAVAIERNKFAQQIESAVARLNGIEEALSSRTAQDLENRRAKIFWTACQTLLENLTSAGSEYSTQLREVQFIRELAVDNDFVQSICNSFPKEALEKGVPTEQGLKRRFSRVHKMARRTAQIDDNGGGLLKYLLSLLQSVVMVQVPVSCSAEDQVDLNKYDPYDLLARIHYFVEEQNDLMNAVRLANLLRGEPSRIFHDWIVDARSYLEARYLVELLFAHAQAMGIRTTY